RPLSIVVVRRGPAEISHHAVAEIFRHMAIEARDRFGSDSMITRDRLAPLLGIEFSGDRCRAHKIAKEPRQVPPLSGYLPRLNRRCVGNLSTNWRGEGCAAFATKV